MNATNIKLRAATDQLMADMREQFKDLSPLTLIAIRDKIGLLAELSTNADDRLIFVLAGLAFDDLACEVEV